MRVLRSTGMGLGTALVVVLGAGLAYVVAVMAGLPLPISPPGELPNLLAPFLSQNGGEGQSCAWVLYQGGCW